MKKAQSLLAIFVFPLIFLIGMPVFCIETTIKGGKMELVDQGERVIFSNGVRLVRGKDSMTAEKMVTDKNREKLHAFGDVKLYRKLDNGDDWKGFGAEGFYNSKMGGGYLLGKAKQAHMIFNQIVSSTQTRKMDLFADRIDFSNNEQIGYAKGKVYGRSQDPQTDELYQFWSTDAEYDRQKGTIVLTGEVQPLVKQSKGFEEKIIKGDVITYYFETRKFISEGKSRAVFMNPPKGRK